MAGKIKGITIEIGGETKGLSKALADVNKQSRDLQKDAQILPALPEYLCFSAYAL